MMWTYLDESQSALRNADRLGEGGRDEQVLRGKFCGRKQGEDCQRHPSAQAAVHNPYCVPVSCAAPSCSMLRSPIPS